MKRKYKVGELIPIGSQRWIIRALDGKGKAVLECMNHEIGALWWTTTTTTLEEQAA
ncbi:hypothetical protein [Microbacterium oleivorans]|uniref:hypothetical protein n=1 Tax=Microbacterium oleivorans TaxID=273677 RepID=UPI0014045B0B|nr:hypothetical protein [Microbacterium oleivorans]